MSQLALQYNFAMIRIGSEEVRMGRSRTCAIVLEGTHASREHAALRQTDEGLIVIDLGSKNGTWVNGDRVNRSRILVVGDQITVGNDVLYVIEDHKPSATVPIDRTTLFDAAPQEDATTVDHGSVIDMAEVLVETCRTLEQRPDTTRAVVSALDELIDRAGISQPYLERSDAQRVRRMADRVVAWWPDGSMEGWRQGLEGRLAVAIDRSPTPDPAGRH